MTVTSSSTYSCNPSLFATGVQNGPIDANYYSLWPSLAASMGTFTHMVLMNMMTAMPRCLVRLARAREMAGASGAPSQCPARGVHQAARNAHPNAPEWPILVDE